MKVRNVAVIGAGVMGIGVAQSLAQAGLEAILVDLDPEILDRAREQIRTNLRMQALFGPKDRLGDPDEVLARIETIASDGSNGTMARKLAEADFVIENVTERWSTKKKVFSELDSGCPPHCVLATNTSAIPISRFASVTERADRIIGIHFMNPVPMKHTVEVIPGAQTSSETVETTLALLERLGKKAVLVRDSPGFVSNRVLMLTINEAIHVLNDEVADAEQIDSVFTSCFGHQMGPLATADLIGLDTILLSLEVLDDCFKDSKYHPCPLLTKMVDSGRLGRKSGQGFYSYELNGETP